MKTTAIPFNGDGSAPHSGGDTSKQAAKRIEPVRQTLRQRVLIYIQNCGVSGATDAEIEQALHLKHQTASARRRELELDGKVYRTTKRRSTGNKGATANVYRASVDGIRNEDQADADPCAQKDVIASKLCTKIKAMDDKEVREAWELLKQKGLI